MPKESTFQKNLVKELKALFPGAFVYKNEPNVSFQGIPDLTILYKDHWAWLECKRSEEEMKDPGKNQPHYIEKGNEMSFARFIYPENKQEVLDDLQQAFGVKRQTRAVKSK